MSVALEGDATRSGTYEMRMSRPATRIEQPTISASHGSSPPPSFKYGTFKRLFDRAYNEWYRSGSINEELAEKVTSQSISVEDFQKLTTGRQLARYIALIDRKIRFDELPKKPHGELAHFLAMILSRQFDEGAIGAILVGCSDNGMIFFSQ
jgi:hypothetical protein